ncbi:MAG: hypothetical protein ACO2PP_15635 [Thermocrinis sp.]|uniref:hypothetical protein n=1 Tax=Thermocrinis sp. TaxID=2024383 RepID=UPI003C0132F7
MAVPQGRWAGQGGKMEQSISLSLPSYPPLKGGEIVKVGEGLYALLLEPLADEPEAYKSVPLRKGTYEIVPVDLLVHEELIEEVVGSISPSLLQIARGIERRPVDFLRDKDEFLREVIAVQWGSEFCLTEPWQRVVVCRKATILITEGANMSALRFSRFGKASVRELPDGKLEVALEAGAAYFTGGYEALPDGGIVKKGPSVKVFVEGEEVLLEDEDLVLYVRGDEGLPEVRVVLR